MQNCIQHAKLYPACKTVSSMQKCMLGHCLGCPRGPKALAPHHVAAHVCWGMAEAAQCPMAFPGSVCIQAQRARASMQPPSRQGPGASAPAGPPSKQSPVPKAAVPPAASQAAPPTSKAAVLQALPHVTGSLSQPAFVTTAGGGTQNRNPAVLSTASAALPSTSKAAMPQTTPPAFSDVPLRGTPPASQSMEEQSDAQQPLIPSPGQSLLWTRDKQQSVTAQVWCHMQCYHGACSIQPPCQY